MWWDNGRDQWGDVHCHQTIEWAAWWHRVLYMNEPDQPLLLLCYGIVFYSQALSCGKLPVLMRYTMLLRCHQSPPCCHQGDIWAAGPYLNDGVKR